MNYKDRYYSKDEQSELLNDGVLQIFSPKDFKGENDISRYASFQGFAMLVNPPAFKLNHRVSKWDYDMRDYLADEQVAQVINNEINKEIEQNKFITNKRIVEIIYEQTKTMTNDSTKAYSDHFHAHYDGHEEESKTQDYAKAKAQEQQEQAVEPEVKKEEKTQKTGNTI